MLPLVYPELSVWDVAELTELVPYDDSPASVSVVFASVSDVSDMPEGARIMLYIDSPAFVNVDDPAEIIPLSITDAEGNDVICLWDEFTGERTVELFIHVSADNWARAALGGYAATIGYRAAVE